MRTTGLAPAVLSKSMAGPARPTLDYEEILMRSDISGNRKKLAFQF